MTERIYIWQTGDDWIDYSNSKYIGDDADLIDYVNTFRLIVINESGFYGNRFFWYHYEQEMRNVRKRI